MEGYNLVYCNIEIMKKKNEYASALDDMFSEDERKRLAGVRCIREIAATIGPVRVRNELIAFLGQFLDDEVNIMLAVLEEITNFSHLLGGSEHEKVLLPLLTSFCKLDEKEVAVKALAIAEPILEKNPDDYLEVIRKLAKANMNIAKQCAAKLIVSAIGAAPHLQATFIEIYNSFIFSDNPSTRIIAVKFLKPIAQKIKNEEEITKIVELIFNDSEDLVKLLCVDTLLILYKSNPNLVMNKFKYLFSLGTWRINLKLCQVSQQLVEILSKSHFKILMQPAYLKFLTLQDDEIRAASCMTLIPLVKNMSQDEVITKLFPLMKKLVHDKVDFVRVEFSTYLLKIAPHLGIDQIKDIVFPLIVEILRENKLELSFGIMSNFDYIAQYMDTEKFENTFFIPLRQQLENQNWRLKCKTINILGKVISKQKKISVNITRFLISLLQDKVEAVRNQGVQIMVELIKKNSVGECDCDVVNDLVKLKYHTSYLIRQKLLQIIDLTTAATTAKYLNDYKKIILGMLSDPVPNIKIKCLKVLTANKKLCDKMIEAQIDKLKDDGDGDVQRLAKTFKN